MYIIRILTFKTTFLILFFLSLRSQQLRNMGIEFIENQTWDQLKEMAMREKKYLFVDCFTTWCGPCKRMEKSVYSDEKVGQFINGNFISVKMQMDSAKSDLPVTIQKYPIAREFEKNYHVIAYPTFLFFSPDGKLVHREVGFKLTNEFIEIAANALNPKTQFYTLLETYQKGNLENSLLPNLAKNVYRILKQKDLTFKLVRDYYDNYLNKIQEKDLLIKDNIDFATWYPKALTSKDKYFWLFQKRAMKVDNIMKQNGYAQKQVDGVITREEILPRLYHEVDNKIKPREKFFPNWLQLSRIIKRKYGQKHAERVILDAKIAWYRANKDWNNSIKFEVTKIDKYGMDTTFLGRYFTNNMIYELIFFHSNDSLILKKAIGWMDAILKAEAFQSAESIDTYANLLYKSGNVADAISWEEKAIKINPNSKSLLTTLDKMKKNKPTWFDKE
jgi:thioredoxin-related protein